MTDSPEPRIPWHALSPALLLQVFTCITRHDDLIDVSQVCSLWRRIIHNNEQQLFETAAFHLSPLIERLGIDNTDDRRLVKERGPWYNCCMRYRAANRTLGRRKLKVVSMDGIEPPFVHKVMATFGPIDREMKTSFVGDVFDVIHSPDTGVGRSTGCTYTLHDTNSPATRSCLDMYNALYSEQRVTPTDRKGALHEINIGSFKNGDLLLNALRFDNEDFYLGNKLIRVGDDLFKYRRLIQEGTREVFILEPTCKSASNQLLKYVQVVIDNGKISHKYLIKTPYPPLALVDLLDGDSEFTLFNSKFYVTVRQDVVTCYSLPSNQIVSKFPILERTTTLSQPSVHADRNYAICPYHLLCFDRVSNTLFAAKLDKSTPVWRAVIRFDTWIKFDYPGRPSFFLADSRYEGRYIQLAGQVQGIFLSALVDMFTGDVKLYGVVKKSAINPKCHNIDKLRRLQVRILSTSIFF